MNVLNAVIAKLVALLLAPFENAPLLGLLVLGFLFGIIATVCYRFCSNQAALRRVSDRTRANLLAVWLFGDDARVGFRAQGGLLVAAAARLWHSLPPLLVMIVPFTLLLTHLAAYYEHRPFTPAETQRSQAALIDVDVSASAWEELSRAQPSLPDGITLDGRVLDPIKHRITWRIRADHDVPDGAFGLGGSPDRRIPKKIVISERTSRLASASPLRPGPAGSFWDRLLYPAEPGLAGNSQIQRMSVSYPKRSTPVFGFDLPWWLTFLLASFVGAFAVKPFLRVQF